MPQGGGRGRGGEARAAWTAAELAELRRHARLTGAGFDLGDCARRIGRSAADANLALDALLGRTPAQAAEALNARGAPPPPRLWGPSGALRGFLREIFG